MSTWRRLFNVCGPLECLEAALEAEGQPQCVIKVSAKRISRWWPRDALAFPTRSGLAAMSTAAKSVSGEGGLTYFCCLRSVDGQHGTDCTDEAPWCIMGCGVGHAVTLAHCPSCPHMREWCSRATFCDRRLVSLRELLGCTPAVEAEAHASIECVRRAVFIAYLRAHMLWAVGDSRRSSGVAAS